MNITSGTKYYAALAYAFAACTKDETLARLQHVAFIGNQIVAGDGERIHIGVLPYEDMSMAPACVARENVSELLLGLEYARRMAAKTTGIFNVTHGATSVTIDYGGNSPIVHPLALVDVGEMPEEWTVPGSSAAAKEAPRLRSSHIKDAQARKSWEDDRVVMTQSYDGGATFVRLDLTVAGDLVKVALLCPVGIPIARLPADEPMFREKGQRFGQSVLDLHIDADGMPYEGKIPEGADGEEEVDEQAKPEKPKRKPRAKKAAAAAPVDDMTGEDPAPEAF